LEDTSKVSQLKKDLAKVLTKLNKKNWYEQKNIKWWSY
jgi:ribosomal protein L29